MNDTACFPALSKSQLVLAGVFLLICWSSGVEPASAQVPRIQGQGTAASGMGNAFSAQADDPSALHYNPAGMTQLHGVEFMAGGLLSGGRNARRTGEGCRPAG